jgi:hypothetical protein
MSQTLQAALTVLGGVFVFVVGQVIVKFFIEPFQERAKLLGEIAGSLIYYTNTTLTLAACRRESLTPLFMPVWGQEQVRIVCF